MYYFRCCRLENRKVNGISVYIIGCGGSKLDYILWLNGVLVVCFYDIFVIIFNIY